MPRRIAHRKTTPTVKHGRTGKKHNWRYTPDADLLAGTSVAYERQRPGKGYQHLLGKSDIERFIALLPDWDELAAGLEAIVLLAGRPDLYGYCSHDGWIAIGAWPRDLWEHFEDAPDLDLGAAVARLPVPIERERGDVVVKWTEETARAFQLLDVLLHELGHHHDRMATRTQRRTARGEGYAVQYAARYMEQIWDGYQTEFGLSY